jgi:hypothetical protein
MARSTRLLVGLCLSLGLTAAVVGCADTTKPTKPADKMTGGKMDDKMGDKMAGDKMGDKMAEKK